MIHNSTTKMTATISNGSDTLSGVSLPKETRLGAGGKELPELYRWELPVPIFAIPSAANVSFDISSNRSSGNEMQDRLAFLHMLEQLKVNDIFKTFLRRTTM
jgi:hypothetical protein